MPTDLLEKPLETAEAREVAKAKAPDTFESQGKTPNRELKSAWRRVFEGHEEFLGWTPD